MYDDISQDIRVGRFRFVIQSPMAALAACVISSSPPTHHHLTTSFQCTTTTNPGLRFPGRPRTSITSNPFPSRGRQSGNSTLREAQRMETNFTRGLWWVSFAPRQLPLLAHLPQVMVELTPSVTSLSIL